MSRTQEQLRGDFDRLFPDRDWNQSCQAVVAHAAEFTVGNVRFYLTAKDAYHASKIVSKNPGKAVANDVHYWAIGTAWHTGVQLPDGTVLMGTKHTDGSWGKNLGVTSVADYTAATGAVYMGFAHSNGVNRIAVVKPKPTAVNAKVQRIARWLNDQHLGKTTKAAAHGNVDRTGKKAQAYWWLIQAWGIREHKYPVPPYRHDARPAPVGGLTRKLEDEIDALILAAKK